MKKDYIIPTIFLINYEEESKLLSGSFRADCVHAAPDVPYDAMDDHKLRIVDDENLSEDDYAKKNDWFFDDNAFSDFR